MKSNKLSYTAINTDYFPDHVTIVFGSEKLEYKKRVWEIDEQTKGLRYGENPDQPAAMYQLEKGSLNFGGIEWRGPGNALVSALNEEHMIQAGKHPGKTNLTDVDNGANILQYLWEKPAAIIIKHNNPCGASWVAHEEGGIFAALNNAFWSDRIAAFGGAVIVNSPINQDCAQILSANYFEVIAAPSYEEGTVEILKARKNLRILELPALGRLEEFLASAVLDIKSLSDGGLIIQKAFKNRIHSNSDFFPAEATTKEGLEVCTRKPTEKELDDLRFAWAVEAGVTSNSVIFAKNGTTVAIGTGVQDRVGCVEIAIHKAYTKYADELSFRDTGLSLYELRQKSNDDSSMKDKLSDIEEKTRRNHAGLESSRLVSDGFFPFRDGVDVAISEGVTAIAQPGGSIRDADVIMACNEATPQVAMVFTGQRSFRH